VRHTRAQSARCALREVRPPPPPRVRRSRNSALPIAASRTVKSDSIQAVAATVPTMDLFASEGRAKEAELARPEMYVKNAVEEYPVWLAPAGGLR